MTLGLHRSLRLSGMFSSMAPCSGAATSRWTACRLDVDNRSLFTSPRRPRPATLNGQMHASVGSRSSPPLLSFAAACGAAPLGVPQSHWQCRWSSTSGICTHASTSRAYSTRQWVQRSAGSQMHNQKQVSFGSAVKRTHNRKAFQATSSRGAADEGDTAVLGIHSYIHHKIEAQSSCAATAVYRMLILHIYCPAQTFFGNNR